MNRKLKINKKFVPANVDENDEIFANGIFLFNITKLLHFVKSDPKKFQVETVSIFEHIKLAPENLDESTIEKADLAEPIILAEISPGRFNVIDGNHRVERARRLNRTTLPGIRISPDTHVQFLTTEKGYKTYVQYWNDKLGQTNE